MPSVQLLATLGDSAPGPGAAGYYNNDFEPNNQAIGGVGGAGSRSGGALGGGVFNGNMGLGATPPPAVTMSNTAVSETHAEGSAAGSGGSTGQGIGGGIYNLGDFYVPGRGRDSVRVTHHWVRPHVAQSKA